MGVVNNGEPWRSEIPLSDTLTLGVRAPQIETSDVSKGGVLRWQQCGTWYPEHTTTQWDYKAALHLGNLVTGDERSLFFFLNRNR